MKAILEGLLFISGDDGLTLDEISDVLEVDKEQVKSLIKELYEDYQNKDRGISLEFLGNHFKLTTKKEHKKYYEKLVHNDNDKALSNSALEVLSIIAYNEPISRSGIDEIRGVNSSYILRKLLLNGLIEDKGRSDSPGRPLVYGVTSRFLDYFGLGSTKDLPVLKAIEIQDNEVIFDTKYKEDTSNSR